jgi:ribA/ribD-fused uncharacterized protein
MNILPAITSFKDEYSFLSNMYPTPMLIEFKGYVFTCTESAYQGFKVMQPDYFQSLNGYQAKRVSKSYVMRSDWDTLKNPLMYSLLIEKFRQPELRELLMDTDGMELIEGNQWGDTYWGVSGGIGANTLGRMLMQLRSEIIIGAR